MNRKDISLKKKKIFIIFLIVFFSSFKIKKKIKKKKRMQSKNLDLKNINNKNHKIIEQSQINEYAKGKNFLFSSVGDNTTFDNLWFGQNMNYDVYVIYYGDNLKNFNKYKSKVKFIESRKGSKFQNFNYFYHKYPEIINQYDRFFILDNDIILSVNEINRMFYFSRKYNLDICGPSFSNKGKISHKITRNKVNILLSYTNFVEVNVPLFNKIALENLMNKYDNCLIEWGVDFFYIYCNGKEKERSYAIIHDVKCINPRERNKKSKNRELNLISNSKNKIRIYLEFCKKNNIKPYFRHKVYKNITSV